MKRLKLYEGFIDDKNKEFINHEIARNKEHEEFLENSIKGMKIKIEECLVTLMDDYDLVPDEFMTYGASKMINNAIFIKNKGNISIIGSFKYKIEHGKNINKIDYIDNKFIKNIALAHRKLLDLGLYLEVNSFELYDEELNYESSKNYTGNDLLSELTNLLSTGRFVIADLRINIIDKGV